MEIEFAYKKEITRLVERCQTQLDEKEKQHRNEIQRLCAEYRLFIESLLETRKQIYRKKEEKKNEKLHATIKLMEKNTERMDQQLKELKDSIEILNLEKIALVDYNNTLVKNETILTDKLNDALSNLDKKQEKLAELETVGIKLRAEIQPLVYMKDNLEKKISAMEDCNKIQLERIECLENINDELLNECNHLKKNQKDLEEVTSLEQDNWTLKQKLLNIEKTKEEVTEKLEELKNKYDELKGKNLALIHDIKYLKLNKHRLKYEMKQNEELHNKIKSMGTDTERMDQQLKELKDSIEILKLEKIALLDRNHILVENETILTDKLNDALSNLDKKQEKLVELETVGIKLRAEIQPLVYMKDNLEKKISAMEDCNKIQLERIECLENINDELLNECNHLKKNQKDLEEVTSLEQDNWTLKQKLLNIEKTKEEVTEKLEELKNKYDELKGKNLALIHDIKYLKLNKHRLKYEMKQNEELHNKIKSMGTDTERMDQQLKELKDSIEILKLEKIALIDRNNTLVKNETKLVKKFNDELLNLNKKQNQLAEVETLNLEIKTLQLKAEIQQLVYMKDDLEKKVSAMEDCNKMQLERIECLQNFNNVLLNGCNHVKNDNLELQLISTGKTAIEWQKKYFELLNKNIDVKNKS